MGAIWNVVVAIAKNPTVQGWAVFGACAIFTAVGVVVSIFVFPPTGTLSGSQLFLLGVVIAGAMMLVSYGAKYANPQLRVIFTPVDLLQFLLQGFLWPATWPALAEKIGQVVITKPAPASLMDVLRQLGSNWN